ncbi:hypothetical protein, partial [Salmonella sp. SAL4445]|uniref:hypothetical protein n=1 Tax=Salmonella sp. SAL4445 TaxID=3159900 RepID=UPI00397C3E18
METRNRVLSVEGLTPEQKKQRDNYAVELAAAEAKLRGSARQTQATQELHGDWHLGISSLE